MRANSSPSPFKLPFFLKLRGGFGTKTLKLASGKPALFNNLLPSIFRKMRMGSGRQLDRFYFDSGLVRLRNGFAPKLDRKVESQEQKPFDVPSPLKSSTVAASYRQNELRLVCTELDRMGHLQLRQGHFPKSSLCSTFGLQARDLRKLDGTLQNQLPSILIRPSAILMNFDFVRAVVKCDRVIFFAGSQDADPFQNNLLKELQTKLVGNPPSSLPTSPSSSTTTTSTSALNINGMNPATISSINSNNLLPFEFVVIESIMQTSLQALQDEFDSMEPEIEKHLTVLERFVHWDKLKTMLECKKRVALFHERISNLRNCIAEVLESDADMAAMYLTAKSSNSLPRPVYAHEEIELLLESYLKQAEEIASRVQLLASNIQSTEDIVNIGLVGQRNELLLLELKLGIGTFAASMGGFGAGILGMNLRNGFESSPEAFWLTISGLLSVSILAFTSSWRRMLKLIRKY